MKKSIFLFILSLALFMNVASFTSASLVVEPSAALYNIGDDFSISIKITSATATSDFLSVALECNEGEKTEIYKSPLSISAAETKQITIPARFDSFLLGNLRGNCNFRASFNKEQATSTPFEITNSIVLIVNPDKTSIEPASTVQIRGTATKRNGKPLDGFIELKISALNIKNVGVVNAGVINISLVIPQKTAAGTYIIAASATERDNTNSIINEGTAAAQLTIKQVPTTVDVALSDTEIVPPYDLHYTPLIYDQTEKIIEESLLIKILSSGNKIEEKKVEPSKVSQVLSLLPNATPGTWTIEAQFGNLGAHKYFIVKEFENATFILQNGTLTIFNSGNVPYKKTVEVAIGNHNEILYTNIPVNGLSKVRLLAPDGSYEITIKEGNESHQLGSSFLTGKAVGIKYINNGILSNVAPWIWFAIIILLAASVVYYYRKVKPRTSWATENTEKESKEQPQAAPSKNQKMMAQNEAGGKQECTIIAMHIKNAQQIESSHDTPAAALLVRILEKARASGIRTYQQGAFKILALIIKNNKEPALPVLDALNTASEIAALCDEHNKKYALKINYGIGVHKGYMIIENNEGKTKLTAIGNTITAAKNLAEYSQNQIRMSDDIYRSVLGKVKSEKIAEKQWKLISMPKRSQHSEFISKFMQRNQK